jgi:hypothetical protein
MMRWLCCGREGQCEPSIEAESDGRAWFDVLALRQEDGVPKIGCRWCCWCRALLLKWCGILSCQTIDADQPLLSMQLRTIGACLPCLVPRRQHSSGVVGEQQSS